ncbi:sensor histidine kinase [Nocardiopsis changdeensis]|uniref:histidine kinase n=1 Tax=Nocardiopsis changdeensis TaxID=2831969 RepID=A0ABX8BHG3_9ACTN|nr:MULTISPECIES: sensor histidine kinase [Nocardiopsis]QUX21665.1 CHASE3 domain-containing protein [Nocardiopsis changdeensis]QYX37599.1 CHASE3 domain-containing protein [Nocardiopsis sp. MT53]
MATDTDGAEARPDTGAPPTPSVGGVHFVNGDRGRPAVPHESWSLRRRVTSLLTVVAVVLVVAVSIITLAAFSARDSLALQVDELTPAVGSVEQLRSAYLTQDHALRGYILTEEREFLQPYIDARLKITEERALLRELADSRREEDPVLASNIDALLRAGEIWTDEFAEPTLEQVGNGQEPSPDDLRRGRVLYLELTRSSEAALRNLQNEIEEARSGLTLATQQVVALLVLVGLVVVFLSVFLWVMLQQWVLRPLEELAGHMRQVSEGYYAHRISLHGPPEIVRLGRDVDAMRERIVQDLDEVASARRKLQEQSALLEHQAEELRRSNLELEQFAYVASHDLQEPLRKVASFCQLLQRRYHGQLDERADSYIDFAVEGAKRMQTLINDLLAFSRVGRTKNFAAVDLDAALDDALSSLSTRLEETGAEVVWDGLPTVQGDRTLLTQVFFNLVGNAVKFRGEEDPRVRIGVERRGDEWIFCCQDNGIGIEPQYAERIFVIFQRLHTREKYTGTGIGLAMCKKIVEFHGGRIWLDTSHGSETSGEGEAPRTGTRICWSLPVDPGQEETAEADGAPAAREALADDGVQEAETAPAAPAPTAARWSTGRGGPEADASGGDSPGATSTAPVSDGGTVPPDDGADPDRGSEA